MVKDKTKIGFSFTRILLIHQIKMMLSKLIKEETRKNIFAQTLLEIPICKLYQNIFQSEENSGLPNVL